MHVDAVSKPEWIGEALRTTDADTGRDLADVEEDEAMTRRALEQLGSNRNDAWLARKFVRVVPALTGGGAW